MSNSNNNFIKYTKNNSEYSISSSEYNQTIQTFISFIIIGYFGVKIVYSTFFNYYPDKFYNKSIEISKDETNKDKSVISTYIPNYWNNEFIDFITVLTLSFVIYIFSNFNSKNIITSNGTISPSFFIGYIIGLGYPIYKKYTTNDEFEKNKSDSIIIGLLFLITIIVIISNYSTNENHSADISIYFVTIFILIYGLYLSRKKSTSKLTTKVFNSKNDKCASSTTGIIQTSGEKINISIPFISFIILLLFKHDPSNNAFRFAIYLLFGSLLGIFVSSISYFGIEYFLEKTPEKICNDINECQIKDMTYQSKSFYEITKEYIDNLLGTKLSKESEDLLKKTKKYLEEEHISNENKKIQTQNESVLDKVTKNLGVKEKRSFVTTFKNAATLLLVLLILYLIYLVIFRSMP